MEKICLNPTCKKAFNNDRPDVKYCSPSCRGKHWRAKKEALGNVTPPTVDTPTAQNHSITPDKIIPKHMNPEGMSMNERLLWMKINELTDQRNELKGELGKVTEKLESKTEAYNKLKYDFDIAKYDHENELSGIENAGPSLGEATFDFLKSDQAPKVIESFGALLSGFVGKSKELPPPGNNDESLNEPKLREWVQSCVSLLEKFSDDELKVWQGIIHPVGKITNGEGQRFLLPQLDLFVKDAITKIKNSQN